jgi:hypothetical protein
MALDQSVLSELADALKSKAPMASTSSAKQSRNSQQLWIGPTR